MAHLYLRREAAQGSPCVPSAVCRPEAKPTPFQARPELYGAFSVVDDVKGKASTQIKSGKLELYTPTYYASCTVGGLMACVRISCFYFPFSL
jgi:solute carrier family 25 (mitochondrial phosphate transporter), member 3